MKKMAITTDDVMRQLNTKIKTSLDGIKVALHDPTKSAAIIAQMVETAYREIISIIALLPATTTVMAPTVPATPAATPTPVADDGETKKPLFWRKNLDYGER